MELLYSMVPTACGGYVCTLAALSCSLPGLCHVWVFSIFKMVRLKSVGKELPSPSFKNSNNNNNENKFLITPCPKHGMDFSVPDLILCNSLHTSILKCSWCVWVNGWSIPFALPSSAILVSSILSCFDTLPFPSCFKCTANKVGNFVWWCTTRPFSAWFGVWYQMEATSQHRVGRSG